MIAAMLRSKHSRIGVDVGSVGVRAVQLLRRDETYTVRAMAHCERPADRVEDVDASLERRLSACLSGGGFRGRNLAMGARAGQLEYHLLELPGVLMARADHATAQAVQWEVGSLMGQSVDKIEARYWQLPPPSAPGPNTLAVGARSDIVRGTVEACTRAGAVCTSIDAPATALCRVGCALRAASPTSVWGILDLGYEQTRLVVCVDETPVLVRGVGPGGKAWTERIAETLRLSLKAAEVHKREHGIAQSPHGVRRDDPADTSRAALGNLLHGALRANLNELAGETKRSFRYVLSCYAGRETGDLVLVGGGANFKRLAEFLSGRLGVSARRASDYLQRRDCRIRFSSGRGEPFEPFALATGLAMTS